MELKVLFLDIDNTLLDFNAAAEESMKHCFRMFELEYQPEMFSVFQEENNKIWRKIEKRELKVADLRTVRWQTILKKLGLEADGAAMEDEFKKSLHESAVPVDGAMEILPYLYGKYRLCAASNGPYEQQINRLQKADMLKYFEHCFVSERMGVEKPARGFFEKCFAVLPEISPEETMMIGDSLTADIAGGRQMGMKSCWYDREQTGHLQEADFTIQNLKLLKEIL